MALTRFTQEQAVGDEGAEEVQAEVDEDRHWAMHGSLYIGVHYMPWERFGVFAETGYAYTPAMTNLMAETHNGGGLSTRLGLRIGL